MSGGVGHLLIPRPRAGGSHAADKNTLSSPAEQAFRAQARNAKRGEGDPGVWMPPISWEESPKVYLSFSATASERNHLGPLPSPCTRCVQGSPEMTIGALVMFLPAYPRPLLANFQSFSTICEISAANLSPLANPRLHLGHECACEHVRRSRSRSRGGDGACAPPPSLAAKGGGGWRGSGEQLSCRSVRSRHGPAQARGRTARQSQRLPPWRPLGRASGTAAGVPRLLPRGEGVRRSHCLDGACGHRPRGASRSSRRDVSVFVLHAPLRRRAGGVP